MHPFSAKLCLHHTVFSWMIDGGNNLREVDDFREVIILNISLLKSNKLNMGFLSVPNLAP